MPEKRPVFSISLVNTPRGFAYQPFVVADPLKQIGLMGRIEIDESSQNFITDCVMSLLRLTPEVAASKPQLLFAIAYQPESQVLAEAGIRLRVSSRVPLYEFQRARIERVFGCPVINAYTCSEIGIIGAECPFRTGMHLDRCVLFPEALEYQSHDRLQHLLISSLRNKAMPLFRYNIGDLVTIETGSCCCGSDSPRIQAITSTKHSTCLILRNGHLLYPHRLAMVLGKKRIYRFRSTQPEPGYLKIHISKNAFLRESPSSISTLISELSPECLGELRIEIVSDEVDERVGSSGQIV